MFISEGRVLRAEGAAGAKALRQEKAWLLEDKQGGLCGWRAVSKRVRRRGQRSDGGWGGHILSCRGKGHGKNGGFYSE